MKLTFGNIESIEVVRREDEFGSIAVKIATEDGASLVFECGRFYDEISELHTMFETLATDAGSIIERWQDVPDQDSDAFVYEGERGGYTVYLEGAQWDGTVLARVHHNSTTFPTRDIAEYELAAAMSSSGCFPNTWFMNERGIIADIGKSIRKYHDDGGTDLLPLDGVEYETGADVVVRIRIQTAAFTWEDAEVSGEVIRDYGTELGIVYCCSGDGDPHHTNDRADVRADNSAEDEA